MKKLNSDVPTGTAAERHEAGSPLWPDLALLSVAVIWGVNIPIMKTGLEQVNVFVFNAVRLSVSALVLNLFAWRERRRGIVPTGSISWRQLIVYALMISAVYQLLFLLGVSRTTSGNVALIIATVPMWTALFARVFIGERLRLISWWGLTIALAGTIVVALQKGDVDAGREHLIGNAFILAAALIWSGGTVYSRPLLAHITPMQLAAWAAAFALPVHLFCGWGKYAENLPALRSPGLWAIILYSGILSSGLSQPMWSFAVRYAGASHAGVVQNLIPLVAILTAWITRGEPATPAQMIGGTLILGGLIVMRAGRGTPPPLPNRY